MPRYLVPLFVATRGVNDTHLLGSDESPVDTITWSIVDSYKRKQVGPIETCHIACSAPEAPQTVVTGDDCIPASTHSVLSSSLSAGAGAGAEIELSKVEDEAKTEIEAQSSADNTRAKNSELTIKQAIKHLEQRLSAQFAQQLVCSAANDVHKKQQSAQQTIINHNQVNASTNNNASAHSEATFAAKLSASLCEKQQPNSELSDTAINENDNENVNENVNENGNENETENRHRDQQCNSNSKNKSKNRALDGNLFAFVAPNALHMRQVLHPRSRHAHVPLLRHWYTYYDLSNQFEAYMSAKCNPNDCETAAATTTRQCCCHNTVHNELSSYAQQQQQQEQHQQPMKQQHLSCNCDDTSINARLANHSNKEQQQQPIARGCTWQNNIAQSMTSISRMVTRKSSSNSLSLALDAQQVCIQQHKQQTQHTRRRRGRRSGRLRGKAKEKWKKV